MSIEAFMQGPPGAAVSIVNDADRILRVLLDGRGRTDAFLHGRVDADATGFTGETECLIRMLGDWGVYGVGISALPHRPAPFARMLLLHPLWLAMDMARIWPGDTYIEADRAEWARPLLERLLDMELGEYVFQASTEPEPLLSSGSGTSCTTATGTLGPHVTWWADQYGAVLPRDRSAGGVPMKGFLTAGHVTDGTVGSTVQATAHGAPQSGTVVAIEKPVPYARTPLGAAVTGGADAALLDFGSGNVSGTGSGAGAAPADSTVFKEGSKTKRTEGIATNYMVWCGGSKRVWSDCYGIVLNARLAAQYGRFSDHGDSGASVQRHDTKDVIGIVVGSAITVSGCHQSVSYVQDIATIEDRIQCTVVP